MKDLGVFRNVFFPQKNVIFQKEHDDEQGI